MTNLVFNFTVIIRTAGYMLEGKRGSIRQGRVN